MNISAKSQTMILWWSLISLIIFAIAFCALLGMAPPPTPSLSPSEVANFYAENAMQIKFGAVISSITSAFLIPFSIVLGFQLSRIEQGPPVWSSLAAAGGCMTCIFLVIPPVLWGAAAFTAGRAPELTALVNEIANLSLITTGQFYIFNTIPLVYLGLKAKPDTLSAFPRWLCFFTLFMTVVGETGVLAFMFKTGPFAWDGLLSFYIPFALYFTWIAFVYYFMFAGLKKQAEA